MQKALNHVNTKKLTLTARITFKALPLIQQT